jgi:hypothetical protein
MRAHGRRFACLVLLSLLPVSNAHATQAITAPLRPAPADADTSVAHIASLASSAGFSSTGTGVFLGLGLMLAAIPLQSGGVFFAGYGVGAVGAILGPTAGWSRAGYSGRAAVGTFVRVGIIVGCVAFPLTDKATADSDYGPVAVAGAALTGLVLASFEAYMECSAIGPYVRKHGPAWAPIALEPARSPSGAPALALVARFR